MISQEETTRLLRAIANVGHATFEETQLPDGEVEIRIRIAAPEKREKPAPTPPRVRTSSGEQLRVLHVEDTDRASDLIHYYLRGMYYVDTVPTAERAIELALANSYDFVLMDMNLGAGMNGFELTEVLRRTEAYERTPIIAITGYTAKKDVERCLAAGCSAYLSKPFLKEDLLRVLSELS